MHYKDGITGKLTCRHLTAKYERPVTGDAVYSPVTPVAFVHDPAAKGDFKAVDPSKKT